MNLGHLVVRFFSLNSGNLICRSTDISMYFREFLGVRDNESRLYLRRAVFAFPIVNICSKEDFFSRLQEEQTIFFFRDILLIREKIDHSMENSHRSLLMHLIFSNHFENGTN